MILLYLRWFLGVSDSIASCVAQNGVSGYDHALLKWGSCSSCAIPYSTMVGMPIASDGAGAFQMPPSCRQKRSSTVEGRADVDFNPALFVTEISPSSVLSKARSRPVTVPLFLRPGAHRQGDGFFRTLVAGQGRSTLSRSTLELRHIGSRAKPLPEPVRTMTLTSSSRPAPIAASRTSSAIAGVQALSLSGLFNVIVVTPSTTV